MSSPQSSWKSWEQCLSQNVEISRYKSDWILELLRLEKENTRKAVNSQTCWAKQPRHKGVSLNDPRFKSKLNYSVVLDIVTGSQDTAGGRGERDSGILIMLLLKDHSINVLTLWKIHWAGYLWELCVHYTLIIFSHFF